MSQREDQIRTAVIAALSGVNERAAKTDLQSQESSLLEGTYPARTGRQSKLPGKALLKKFAESVYGIHQFWTPYGYGGNTYQFDGSVGFDPWITPPGGPIKTTPLPYPPTDSTHVTVDELGNNPTFPDGGVDLPGPNTGGNGNGTSSTPGGPPPPPPPPGPDYSLRDRAFYIFGVGIRHLADVLYVAISEDEPTPIAGFSYHNTPVGIHTYHHPSGLYSDITYEALPLDPPIPPYPTVGGGDYVLLGGYNVYTHYLESNSASMYVDISGWNG